MGLDETIQAANAIKAEKVAPMPLPQATWRGRLEGGREEVPRESEERNNIGRDRETQILI